MIPREAAVGIPVGGGELVTGPVAVGAGVLVSAVDVATCSVVVAVPLVPAEFELINHQMPAMISRTTMMPRPRSSRPRPM